MFIPFMIKVLAGIVTGWTAGGRFQAGHQIFLLSTESRPVLRPTQPHNQLRAGASFPEDKAAGA
jgi:hypothetical protein